MVNGLGFCCFAFSKFWLPNFSGNFWFCVKFLGRNFEDEGVRLCRFLTKCVAYVNRLGVYSPFVVFSFCFEFTRERVNVE